MALHSSTALLDMGTFCKRHGIHNQCFKYRGGFLALNRSSLRNGNQFHRHSLNMCSVMAMAETATSEEVKLDDDKVDKILRPIVQNIGEPLAFKITSLDEGGKKGWHPAAVLAVQELAPDVRVITIEAEVSREMVALEDSYSTQGRLAQVKVNGGKAMTVAACSPPFTTKANEVVLLKVRGDIPAGTTKQPQYFLSVKHPLELLVYESETPSVFSLKEGDQVELGPFDLSGLDLRPILFLTRYPTILFFASGKGIALAKSIIETKDADVGSMTLGMREDIRLFYWSSDPSKVLFKDHFKKWENKKLKVRAAVGKLSDQEWDGHVGSFTSLWDEDDIEYDPSTTGVIVSVDRASRKEVKELLADAGIPETQIINWEP